MEKLLSYYDEEEIKKLLMYRKVVKVSDDTLRLDNGIELEIYPNEGCGGCSSGWYDITDLNECDNIITNVEFECKRIGIGKWSDEYSYRIFVYAENKKIKMLQVDGDDGNGYYGTGYEINVKMPQDSEV